MEKESRDAVVVGPYGSGFRGRGNVDRRDGGGDPHSGKKGDTATWSEDLSEGEGEDWETAGKGRWSVGVVKTILHLVWYPRETSLRKLPKSNVNLGLGNVHCLLR